MRRERKIIMAKRGNNLDGKNWIKNSISIWSDIRKTKEEKTLKHPAVYPSALAKRLIECFIFDEGSVILDPFAGIGSTLLAASDLGMNATGLEISPDFADIAKTRVPSSTIHVADSRDLLNYVPKGVDMVVTSPPYWDILSQKRTAYHKEETNYSEFKGDFGKIEDYNNFLLELKNVFEQVYEVLNYKGYCCIVAMDIRKKNRFYPFHMDISLFMQEIGFTLDDIIIWDRGQEYNNLRPLGYPYVFRVNKIHEFILIFQKLNV